jgi:hypothetical protein
MTAAPLKVKTLQNTQLPEHIRMKWKIECIEDQKIIMAKTSGLMSWHDKKKLCEDILAAGRERNIRLFLVDHKSTSLGLSVLEIDSLPEMFRKIGFEIKDRMAILVNSDSSNFALFSFLQDVFTLSELRVQIFTSTDEATEWLRVKS